jgi:uncharacterized protein YjbI with pentapeptide repeats
MKPLILATTALLTISIATPAKAANSEHLRQLLATKQCQSCNLTDAGLVMADLSGANLSGADLTRANLSRANLTGADLSGAKLNGASLFGAILSGAKLNGADLSGADMREAYLLNADVTGANLSGVSVLGAVGIPSQAATAEDFYKLGMAEGQKGNHQGAIVYFNQAIDADPKYADAFFARSVARYQALDRPGAIQDAKQAGRLYLSQGDAKNLQLAQAFVKEMETPVDTRISKGKPNFLDFLGSVLSLAVQFGQSFIKF